ncbi:MAG: hypothetical protein SNF68_02985 [Rikenellaceae bacterium]
MKYRALILLFAFAATVAVGCSDDDDKSYLDETEFTIKDIKNFIDDDEIPTKDDWTITDSEIYATSSGSYYIKEMIEMAADEGRTINLTLSEVTKIRSEFLTNIKTGLGELHLPKVTDIRYRAFYGTILTAVYLTTEEDFYSKDALSTSDTYGEFFYGIDPSAFDYPDRDNTPLILNANKAGVAIDGLTADGNSPDWGEIIYE